MQILLGNVATMCSTGCRPVKGMSVQCDSITCNSMYVSQTAENRAKGPSHNLFWHHYARNQIPGACTVASSHFRRKQSTNAHSSMILTLLYDPSGGISNLDITEHMRGADLSVTGTSKNNPATIHGDAEGNGPHHFVDTGQRGNQGQS